MYKGMDRVTVAEAAERLGVKEQAVRKRIQRGTIQHDKDDDGRVYVYVDASEPEDARTDTGRHTELVDSLYDQIEFLRRELERKDAVLLRMAEAMKALEAPRKPRDGRVTASEESSGTSVPPEGKKRVWWRRFFDY